MPTKFILVLFAAYVAVAITPIWYHSYKQAHAEYIHAQTLRCVNMCQHMNDVFIACHMDCGQTDGNKSKN